MFQALKWVLFDWWTAHIHEVYIHRDLTMMMQQCTTISRLSMHMFKYTFCLSANFFERKTWFILYCLNIPCKVIFYGCMNFLRMTFNVSLLMFWWNVSKICRNSSYIRPTFVWTHEQNNWSPMLRITLCRVSKALKLVALSNSTNVSLSWISIKRVA